MHAKKIYHLKSYNIETLEEDLMVVSHVCLDLYTIGAIIYTVQQVLSG